jgi:cytohesin
VDVVRALAELGANVDSPEMSGCTPISVAAQEGHMGVVRALVELGANIYTAADGVTPVYIAAERGHIDIVRALADHGADVNTARSDGGTPVYFAAQQGNVAMLCLLVEKGAIINNQDGDSLVCLGAQEGHVDMIRALAELGVNVNTPDPDGCTPVCAAAQEGHTVTVRALAELGADINAPDCDGFSPVYIAAQEGHTATVRALAELSANIDTPASSGATPVYTAARMNHTDVVLYLVSIGADVALLFDTHTALIPPAPVSGMMTRLCEALHVKADTGVYALFAMTKLMSSVMHDEDDATADDREVLEIAIARGFNQSIATSTVPKTQDIPDYPFRRKLCRLAYRVYLETLLFDGERISLITKARRYVELVCFFLDQAMLTDVCALRMTCKSNHLIRRFPVLSYCYELEANLIEGFVGYDACRFVSTSQVHQIIAIHNMA